MGLRYIETVLESAGMTTAQYGHHQDMIFCRNLQKSHQNGETFAKKDTKKSKNSHFCPINFSQSLSNMTNGKSNVASPIVEVQYIPGISEYRDSIGSAHL
jgi:hypothetical protein